MSHYVHYVIVPGRWESLTPDTYGWECCEPGHSFGPAVRSHYLLHYVLEGEGQFQKNGQIYDVKKGDIFVIEPGEVTTYRASVTNPWQYVWLGFHCDGKPPVLNCAVLRQPPVRHIFTYIQEHHADGDLEGKIFSLTYELLWQLSRDGSSSKMKQHSYAAYTKTYLENSYMHPVNIQEIAESQFIDRRYLTQLFRKAYGVPPQTYLMELRLEKAREFLRMGRSVTESAAMAGFTDLSNFTRKYKSRFGVNPSSDRE